MFFHSRHTGLPLDDLKSFEIPGYPHGEDLIPPDSLIWVEGKVLTIEITHTEVIDGSARLQETRIL